MKYEEIIEAIKMLSQSQGFYCRLLKSIREVEEYDYDKFIEMKDYLESKNFKDTVDMVLFFEC